MNEVSQEHKNTHHKEVLNAALEHLLSTDNWRVEGAEFEWHASQVLVKGWASVRRKA